MFRIETVLRADFLDKICGLWGTCPQSGASGPLGDERSYKKQRLSTSQQETRIT
jgi:hypothetical protein